MSARKTWSRGNSETRARSGDVSIAYQVVGEGANDIVFIPGFVSNLEIDVRSVLPAVRTPTLIIHRNGDWDLVAGSGIRFEPRGKRELEGLGEWPVFAVVQSDEPAIGA